MCAGSASSSCPRHDGAGACEGFQTLEHFAIGKGMQPKGGFVAKTLLQPSPSSKSSSAKLRLAPIAGSLLRDVVCGRRHAARAWPHEASVGRRPAAMEAAALPSKQGYSGADLWGVRPVPF